ncbi:hypothetical protein V6C16_12455, partial [Desulfovibrio sp. 1188_IL3213]
STRETDPAILQERARALPAMKGRNLVPFVAPEKPYTWYDNAVAAVTLAGLRKSLRHGGHGAFAGAARFPVKSVGTACAILSGTA